MKYPFQFSLRTAFLVTTLLGVVMAVVRCIYILPEPPERLVAWVNCKSEIFPELSSRIKHSGFEGWEVSQHEYEISDGGYLNLYDTEVSPCEFAVHLAQPKYIGTSADQVAILRIADQRLQAKVRNLDGQLIAMFGKYVGQWNDHPVFDARDVLSNADYNEPPRYIWIGSCSKKPPPETK
jgi:hypothetical protein